MHVWQLPAMLLTPHSVLQADSGIRARPSSQPGADQKFDFGTFLKGDLPKKLLIMLVGKILPGTLHWQLFSHLHLWQQPLCQPKLDLAAHQQQQLLDSLSLCFVICWFCCNSVALGAHQGSLLQQLLLQMQHSPTC